MNDLKNAYGTWARVAARLGMSRQALNNAKGRNGTLAKENYFVHKAILAGDGHTCSPSLWGFAEPERQEADEEAT